MNTTLRAIAIANITSNNNTLIVPNIKDIEYNE